MKYRINTYVKYSGPRVRLQERHWWGWKTIAEEIIAPSSLKGDFKYMRAIQKELEKEQND